MSEATKSGRPEETLRPGPNRRFRRPSIFVAAAFAIAGLTSISAPANGALADPSICGAYASAQFGPNVCVFTPPTGPTATAEQAAIQTVLNNIATQQVPNQFGTERYALLFQPGTYGSPSNPLAFEVGYYEEVAGLGATPAGVVINGVIDSFNQCTGPGACTVLDDFWRSVYNLTIDATTGTGNYDFVPPDPSANNNGCNNTNEMWASSQASPMRRVVVNGFTTLFDYCDTENYSSGGFISDSTFSGGVLNGSQQQFITRNDTINSTWTNAVWNQVFVGDNGNAVPAQNFGPPPASQYTTVAATPVSEEEPFLYTDAGGNFNVQLSTLEHNTSGPGWALPGGDAGQSIPVSRFFIANPNTPIFQINAALAIGRELVLTPGVYNLNAPIIAPHPDSVILGLGFATLVPQHGNPALVVVRNSGVKVSGLLIDAGPVDSPVLMSVGTPARNPASATDPDLISDVFFRVGGAESPAHTNVAFLDNADNSIIDNTWIWRADHGASATSVGWTVNTGDTGLAVTGYNVTAYGLAVEHFQKYEVLWTGENGSDYFFQNELPYDPPSQAQWEVSPSQLGYPAFDVTRNVQTFNGYGMGSYVVFIQTPASLSDSDPFQAPLNPGIHFTDVFTVYISSNAPGGDLSVINGVGPAATNVTDPTVVPEDVPSYTG